MPSAEFYGDGNEIKKNVAMREIIGIVVPLFYKAKVRK